MQNQNEKNQENNDEQEIEKEENETQEEVQEDEQEDEENEDEQEDEESEDESDDESDDEDAPEDHPAYRIRSVIQEIGIQQKRLSSRNPRDLKSELKNNIYPMMEIALEAIADFVEYIDSPDYEEEIAQEALMDAVADTRDVSSRILNIISSIDVIKNEVKEDVAKVKKWAKDYLEKTEELVESEE